MYAYYFTSIKISACTLADSPLPSPPQPAQLPPLPQRKSVGGYSGVSSSVSVPQREHSLLLHFRFRVNRYYFSTMAPRGRTRKVDLLTFFSPASFAYFLTIFFWQPGSSRMDGAIDNMSTYGFPEDLVRRKVKDLLQVSHNLLAYSSSFLSPSPSPS